MFRSLFQNALNKSPLLCSLLRETPKPLGRWSVNKCNTSVSMTNYYNNVDHCGTCDYQTKMIETILREETNQKQETNQKN